MENKQLKQIIFWVLIHFESFYVKYQWSTFLLVLGFMRVGYFINFCKQCCKFVTKEKKIRSQREEELERRMRGDFNLVVDLKGGKCGLSS